ncbi:mechanosensitive ion channel family protein [Nordella sp. HKS 07]|uniref:mechanosensitive ion channel family protein n=1 Tax=Nordella sp. HKS 07 TaxID=2712222 RepID=UPI0013E1B39E|nr:mechanosensitive ion channel family protein [Nordella sp. HKS 07]QIG47221.1 mechanosensitive ion channel family protein [Nordella sp. HKS 07]
MMLLPSRFLALLLSPCLCLLLLTILPQPAEAEQAATVKGPVNIVVDGTETAEALKKVIDEVSGDNHPVSISFAPKPQATVASKVAEDVSFEGVFGLFVRGLREGWNAIPRAPQYLSDFAHWWQSAPESPRLLLYLFKLLVLLCISGFAGWLALRLLKSMGPALPTSDPAPLDQKLRPALARLAKDVAAVAVFIAVAWALFSHFFNPLAAEGKLTQQLIRVIPAIAAFVIVGRFLLSPGEPRLQLFMLPRAKRHFGILTAYSAITMVLLAVFVELGDEVSTASTTAGIFIVVTTLALLFRIWWFWDARHDISQVILSGAPEVGNPGVLRRLFAIATPWLLILISMLLWAIGRIAETLPDGEQLVAASSVTQVLVILIPILAVGASMLVRQRLIGTDPDPIPIRAALRTLMVKLSGAAAWLLGLLLLGWTWRSHLMESQSAEGLTVLKNTISILAVVVAAWALTSFLNALFRAYSPRAALSTDNDDHVVTATTVQTRLGSVLPILRGFTIGTVVGLTILLVMSQLGFDIGPLLAGFGILGLAVSFGSQTLVKDIVSGFFFMVEDAFRVGEYIDTGKLKGTVEKISLRSLQLRHQSGLVHTIPFGTLSSVTNASRDWATVKFSLRLDRAADIEKARKAIKKIGAEMQSDPEYGDGFMMPLKMQGVDEIADSAIIIRAKFTAKPPMASSIQREALKRIYVAFNKAGIEFASNAVTVRGGGQAEAAAATTSVQQPATVVPAV